MVTHVLRHGHAHNEARNGGGLGEVERGSQHHHFDVVARWDNLKGDVFA